MLVPAIAAAVGGGALLALIATVLLVRRARRAAVVRQAPDGKAASSTDARPVSRDYQLNPLFSSEQQVGLPDASGQAPKSATVVNETALAVSSWPPTYFDVASGSRADHPPHQYMAISPRPPQSAPTYLDVAAVPPRHPGQADKYVDVTAHHASADGAYLDVSAVPPGATQNASTNGRYMDVAPTPDDDTHDRYVDVASHHTDADGRYLHVSPTGAPGPAGSSRPDQYISVNPSELSAPPGNLSSQAYIDVLSTQEPAADRLCPAEAVYASQEATEYNPLYSPEGMLTPANYAALQPPPQRTAPARVANPMYESSEGQFGSEPVYSDADLSGVKRYPNPLYAPSAQADDAHYSNIAL